MSMRHKAVPLHQNICVENLRAIRRAMSDWCRGAALSGGRVVFFME